VVKGASYGSGSDIGYVYTGILGYIPVYTNCVTFQEAVVLTKYGIRDACKDSLDDKMKAAVPTAYENE
jgi:hypothetical protein